MFNIVVVAVIIAVATAAPVEEQHVDYHAHPRYEFHYGVEDHHTGDMHSAREVRDGDVTHGEYSLVEADGTVRRVQYSVDGHSGFNAVVTRSGHASHPSGHAPRVQPVAVQHVQPVAVAHHVQPAAAVHHVQPVALAHVQPAVALHHAPASSHNQGHATSYSSVVQHVHSAHH